MLVDTDCLTKVLHNLPRLPYRLGPKLLESRGGFVVRIAENARRSVVFFGIPEPPLGEIKYGGTGFLLAYEKDGVFFPYVVTNRHVAKRLENEPEFTLRANLKSGGSDPMSIEDATWAYHPDTDVDLAASMIYLDNRVYDHGFFGGKTHKADQVLCGDPVSIVGLFRLREGSTKNVPVVHTGHIATLPDPTERIPVKDPSTGKIINAEAYLVEAQTLDGLSGAPVFTREIIGVKFPGGTAGTVYGNDVRLLGVYQGSFKGIPDETLAKEHKLPDGRAVPVGMGIVIPSEKIDELMEHKDLVATREKYKHLGVVRRAATEDSGFHADPISAPPTKDDNPQGREDFNSLLDAAVSGSEQDHETS